MKRLLYLLLFFIFVPQVMAESNIEGADMISSTEKTYITTTLEDALGNVFEVNNIEVPEDQLWNIDYLIAQEEVKYTKRINNRDIGPMVSYSTSAKTIHMDYYHMNGTPSNKLHVYVWVGWITTPAKRDYDIIAVRWTNGATLTNATGKQQTNDGRTTNYSYLGNNMKTASNGVGISMNLHNNTSGHTLEMTVDITASNIGTVFGTYQHATNASTTLVISKSYTFSSSGLGEVIYFNNPTYASYYDGMNGVSLDYILNLN